MAGRPFDLRDPIVIIGAGPAGLGAAYKLQRSGFSDWVLYERESNVGGLSASFFDDKGFTWDLGGHVVFSHYDLFSNLLDDLLGPSGWIEHERESWIRLLNTWVPYPFQNNIHRLPAGERDACLSGLIKAARASRPDSFADFDDFITRTFGARIAGLFMRPYNEKAWAYPPASLSADWIAGRISVPDPTRVARNVELERDDCGWGPNNTFKFPKRGGTGAIWTALAGSLPAENIVTGREIVKVDVNARKVRLSDGREQHYGALISTIPLTELAHCSSRADWVEATAGLVYSSVHVVGVGLKGGPPPDLVSKCWMYFPEDNCPFYRVTHFSHYSHSNVPDIGVQWSLMCEISESPVKPVDGGRVVHDAIKGLVASGLIEDPDAVSHTWSLRAEYAYPTPAKERDQIISSLLPEMYSKRILSRGRFGGWKYEVGNMDHSFMQGYEAADHLINGVPEITLFDPDAVNR